MSSYERTAVQAVIGQKLDGQFQKLIAEYERPIQPKFFSLKQQCAKAEKINPELSNANDTPAAQLRHGYVGSKKAISAFQGVLC